MQTPDTRTSPELLAAQAAREAQAARVADGAARPAVAPAVYDPLSYCIWTTVALIAWVISPPLALAGFGGLGLWAYVRAWRAGLRQSRCFLRDPRLVMLYLGVLLVAGVVGVILNLLRMGA
jgi:hypothetical protein